MGSEWKLWAYSMRGIRHRRKEMMCQDQFSCKKAGKRLSVALVDGIGKTDINAKAGKRVADLVAAFFHEQVDNIRKSDDYTIAFNLMRQIQRLLDQMSSEYGVDPRELSSTLLGIFINPDENFYVMCHLGDGILAMSEDNQKIQIISGPQNGERLNETLVTTSEFALGNIRIKRGILGNIRSFVMATDGFYNTWEDRDALNNAFINDLKDGKIKEKIDDQTVIKIFNSDDNRIVMEECDYGVRL